jgi:hypothetical protein
MADVPGRAAKSEPPQWALKTAKPAVGAMLAPRSAGGGLFCQGVWRFWAAAQPGAETATEVDRHSLAAMFILPHCVCWPASCPDW